MCCCPMYTIRCEALQVRLSKSQKKTLRKFKNYIETGKQPGTEKISEPGEEADGFADNELEKQRSEVEERLNLTNPGGIITSIEPKPKDINKTQEDKPSKGSGPAPTIKHTSDLSKEPTNDPNIQPVCDPTIKPANDPTIKPAIESSVEPASNSPTNSRIKGKVYRRQRWRENQTGKGMLHESKKGNEEKSLEDHLVYEPGAHTFEIRLVPSDPDDDVFVETFLESYAVYQKYQVAVHNDTPEKCSSSQFKRFLCKVNKYLIIIISTGTF